jgi:hypothetical protein
VQPRGTFRRMGLGTLRRWTASERRPSARNGSLPPPIKGAAAADSGADNPVSHRHTGQHDHVRPRKWSARGRSRNAGARPDVAVRLFWRHELSRRWNRALPKPASRSRGAKRGVTLSGWREGEAMLAEVTGARRRQVGTGVSLAVVHTRPMKQNMPGRRWKTRQRGRGRDARG